MASPNFTTHFIEQLDSIVEAYDKLKTQSRYDDLSDIGLANIYTLITRSRSAIERISGDQSAYSRQVEETLARERGVNDFNKLAMIVGVVKSLKTDLEADYLATVEELIHSSLFADFLEMADHLLSEGYKDAAAVMAGGTLEAHLRQLCTKNGIDTEIQTLKGVRSKRSDRMNADMAKASVYSKLDQKNVTAWLDLRNKAAHARYSEYTKEQVALFITGIRDFITRNPA